MSGFKFNAPSSSSASSGGLFGSASSGTTSFGTNNTASGNGGFSFGSSNTAASTSATEQKPLFGTTTGASSIFGKPASTTGGFSFGQAEKSEQTKTAEQSKPPSLFPGAPSNTQTPGTPGTSGSTTPSLFGSTTPAPAGGSTNIFGNPSTTPAGPPPQSTAFGASTGASNLFGMNSQTQPKQDAVKPFNFGQTGVSAQTPSTSQPASAGSFAGLSSAPGSTLFGQKKDEKGTESTKATTGNTEPSKPLFSFPAAGSSTPSATAGTSNLFGGLSKTGESQTPAAAGTLFGNKPAFSQTSQSSTLAQPSTMSSSDSTSKPAFTFPSATTQSSTSFLSTATSTAPIQKPLFGNLGGSSNSSQPLFGDLSSAPSSSAAPTATSSQTSIGFGGFTLGGAKSTPTDTPGTTTNTTSLAATAPAPAPTPFTGFALGGKQSANTSQAAPATLASTVTAAPAMATAAPPATAANLGASTSGPSPPAQSRLKNKTMDEILTRWATDLTKYTKDFKNHAETIAKWDQIIVDNSAKIDKLYVKTRTCEKQTTSVEMQLSSIESQQNELEAWLAKYESDVDELVAKDGASQTELGGPDQERERTYKLAERLGERLDDMGRDLDSMVEEVNAANASLSKQGKSDEPITQIVRILNSHLTQLQQIDQGTAALQAKVSAAQQAAGGMRYTNGSTNGDSRAAVDDFYRSYMGRR